MASDTKSLYYVLADGNPDGPVVIDAKIVQGTTRIDNCLVCGHDILGTDVIVTDPDGPMEYATHVVCVVSNTQVTLIWMTEEEALAYVRVDTDAMHLAV